MHDFIFENDANASESDDVNRPPRSIKPPEANATYSGWLQRQALMRREY